MILADRRFGRSEKFSKLPKWLRDNLGAGSTNLSVEESLAISKKFLRQMAQPFPREAQFGIRSVPACVNGQNKAKICSFLIISVF